MPKSCVIGGCTRNSSKNPKLRFFEFPKKNETVRRQWIQFVETTRSDFSWTKWSLVCGEHFAADCQDLQSKIKASMGIDCRYSLRKDAVPSLRSPNLPSCTMSEAPQNKRFSDAFAKRETSRRNRKTVIPLQSDCSRNNEMKENKSEPASGATRLQTPGHPFASNSQLHNVPGFELRTPDLNAVSAPASQKNRLQTNSGLVHIRVDSNVIPLMTSPLPNVKILYLIRSKDRTIENAARRQVPREQQQHSPKLVQAGSVDQLPLVQENPQDSKKNSGSCQPPQEEQQTIQQCPTDTRLVSNHGRIPTGLVEQFPVVHHKLESSQDPGLSNQAKTEMDSVKNLPVVKIKEEPCWDLKSNTDSQQTVVQEKLHDCQEAQVDNGLGWIKTEPLEQVSDANTGLGNNLLFSASTEVTLQMDVEGNDADDGDEELMNYFQEADRTPIDDENAEISKSEEEAEEEEEEEEEEDYDEDDDWKMEDDSSDEDYVPDLPVKVRKSKTKKVPPELGKEDEEQKGDGTSNTEDWFPSDSEDSEDECMTRKRRAWQKKMEKKPKQKYQNIRQEVLISRMPVTYECRTCRERFPESDSMRRHFSMAHLDTEKQEDLARDGLSVPQEGDILEIAMTLRQCRQCKEYVENMQEHRRSHRVSRFVCEVCGRVFGLRRTLQDHLETHKPREERRLYKCPQCDKTFLIRNSFNHHFKEKHHQSSSKRHVCEKCGKQFTSHSLVVHKRIHLAEKPFKCTECGRGFNQKSNMALHMRLHTGARPYQCKICQEAFNHNVSLKNHQKKKHGIDWWKDKSNKKVA